MTSTGDTPTPTRDLSDCAREAWRLLEPLHAVTYFSAEPLAALKQAGYRGFWMGYFAGRAAPLGPVGPEVVGALFYNFADERVRRALPSAWTFAPPEAALAARAEGSVAALRRAFGESADAVDVARAADLATTAALAAPAEGRTLYAANTALPVPDEPLARLWHAATLLREHRGDGHVAALLTEGVSGREAHVLHAESLGTPSGVYAVSRDYTEDEWSARRRDLLDRGLLTDEGLSASGHQLVERLESVTDTLAAPAYAALTTGERDELLTLLRPLARAVVRTGDLPRASPMGLDLDDLG